MVEEPRVLMWERWAGRRVFDWRRLPGVDWEQFVSEWFGHLSVPRGLSTRRTVAVSLLWVHFAEQYDECVSVREHISETTPPNFTKFLCVLHVAATPFSSGFILIRCVLPVLWMTPCSPIMGPMAAWRCHSSATGCNVVRADTPAE